MDKIICDVQVSLKLVLRQTLWDNLTCFGRLHAMTTPPCRMTVPSGPGSARVPQAPRNDSRIATCMVDIFEPQSSSFTTKRMTEDYPMILIFS